MTTTERRLLRILAEGMLGTHGTDDLRRAIKEELHAMDAEAFWTQAQAFAHVIERDRDVLQGLADYDRAASRVPRYAPTHVSKGFDVPYPTTPAGRAYRAAQQAVGWGSSGASVQAAQRAPEPSGAHYDREAS